MSSVEYMCNSCSRVFSTVTETEEARANFLCDECYQKERRGSIIE